MVIALARPCVFALDSSNDNAVNRRAESALKYKTRWSWPVSSVLDFHFQICIFSYTCHLYLFTSHASIFPLFSYASLC